jgi:hypothetical protein
MMLLWSVVNRYHQCAVSIFRAESRTQQKGLQIRGSRKPRLKAISKSTRNSCHIQDKTSIGGAKKLADWFSWNSRSCFQGQRFLLIWSQPWPWLWSTLLYNHMLYIPHNFICTSTRKMVAAASSQILVPKYQIIWHHIQKGHCLN